MANFGATLKPGAREPIPRPGEVLPWECVNPRTAGQGGCMSKLLFDNRVVGVAFTLLLFLNAYAITARWYA